MIYGCVVVACLTDLSLKPYPYAFRLMLDDVSFSTLVEGPTTPLVAHRRPRARHRLSVSRRAQLTARSSGGSPVRLSRKPTSHAAAKMFDRIALADTTSTSTSMARQSSPASATNGSLPIRPLAAHRQSCSDSRKASRPLAVSTSLRPLRR